MPEARRQAVDILPDMKKKLEIGVGCADINSKDRKYVMEALRSGRLTHGPYCSKFESLFGRFHNVKYSIFVNSGTSALRIAVACLKEVHGWQENDEVICPAVTFPATSNVLIMNGLKPVFADVDSRIYNIDPKEIESKISKRTRAIMVVHLFGQAAEMDPIIKIAEKYGLKIIEDACESPFAAYRGKPVGSFGDISCFSTYQAHIISTGVGGFACTNNSNYAEIMKSLANHGRDGIYLHIDDDKNLSQDGLFRVVARRFRFLRLGYSFRATEMEAALGLGQLERKDGILAARRRNADYLISNLKKFEKILQLPFWPDYNKHSFMMFPIVIKVGAGFTKRDLVNFLEKHDIETRDMLPLINQPVYTKLFGDLENEYPVAKLINNNGFYIGCHQKLKKGDLVYIISKFEEFFKKNKNSIGEIHE